MITCSLHINQKLAIFALALGFIAIFAGNPQSKNRTTVDTKELAAQIASDNDKISATDLADKIVKGESDFRLIDLRKESEFNKYHIPLAENLRVTDFNDIDMPRNEKYYLISDNDILTGQAWSLLKARGYIAVYVVTGGISNWEDCILFPKLSADASAEEIAKFNKIKEISKFFGGNPQTGVESADNGAKINMPKPIMPAQVQVKRSGKMKKEGC